MVHNFKKLGKNAKYFDHTIFIKPETICLDDNTQIDDFVFIYGGQETIIAHNVHIASFVSIIGGGRFIMAPFAGLSAGCRVVTGSDDFTGESLTNPTVPKEYKKTKLGTVEIGRHALIGSNAVILPDVKIGEGTIVSAGALVIKDLEPWSIYAGYNPKKIGQRDKRKILALELDYYKKYFSAAETAKYQERIGAIEEELSQP